MTSSFLLTPGLCEKDLWKKDILEGEDILGGTRSHWPDSSLGALLLGQPQSPSTHQPESLTLPFCDLAGRGSVTLSAAPCQALSPGPPLSRG